MKPIQRRPVFGALIALICITGAPLANAQYSGTLCNFMISPNAPFQPAAHYVGDFITLQVDRPSLFNFIYGGTNTLLSGEATIKTVVAPGPGPAVLVAQAAPGQAWGNCELHTNIFANLNAQFSYTGNLYTVTNLSFSNTSTGGGGGSSYLWNFGDGETSTQQNPSHSYNIAGNYTVQLTVTDQYGKADSDSQTLAIVDNPNVPGPPSALYAEFLGCSFNVGSYSLTWSSTGAQPSNYYAYEFKQGGATSWTSVQWLPTASKTENINGRLSNKFRVRGCLSASESTCGPSRTKVFYSVNCSGGGEPD